MIRSDETSLDDGKGVFEDDTSSKKHAKVFQNLSVIDTRIVFECFFEVGKDVEIAVTDSCFFNLNSC